MVQLKGGSVDSTGIICDKENEMVQVAIDEIKVPRDRKVRGDLEELKKSIQAMGLLHPITLDGNDKLVAGFNRLQACKDLGWTKIPVTRLKDPVDGLSKKNQSRLAEIDENLVRTNLSALQEGKLLKERKKIYEKCFPDSKKGGDRRSVTRKKRARAFTEDVAKKTGKSRRTIERGVEIGTKLSPKAQGLIEGTSLANNRRELGKIAKLKPLAQSKYIKQYLKDEESGAHKKQRETRKREPKVAISVLKSFYSSVRAAIKENLRSEKQAETLLAVIKELYTKAKS